MLTEAQRILIREICNLQYSSLTDILTQVDLYNDGDGEPYEDVMALLGFGRKDFDVQLIITINNFKGVMDDPEKVFELEELDMIVFRHILHNFSHWWSDRYPNAMANLWDKLFLQSITNELNRN